MSRGYLFRLHEQALLGWAPRLRLSLLESPKVKQERPSQWKKPLLMTMLQSDVPPFTGSHVVGVLCSLLSLIACVCRCIPFPKDMGQNLGAYDKSCFLSKVQKMNKSEASTSNIGVFPSVFYSCALSLPIISNHFQCHYKTP